MVSVDQSWQLCLLSLGPPSCSMAASDMKWSGCNTLPVLQAMAATSNRRSPGVSPPAMTPAVAVWPSLQVAPHHGGNHPLPLAQLHDG